MRARRQSQQVRTRADHRDQRHHQLFPDRVDRWVGDLGEVLLEVVVKQFRLATEDGDGRVCSHRADRIVAKLRHRLEEELHVFLRVAKRLLAIEQADIGVL